MQICLAHKGYLWIEVETNGRAAHGSRFEQGIDANMRMGRFLAELGQTGTRPARPPAASAGGPSVAARRDDPWRRRPEHLRRILQIADRAADDSGRNGSAGCCAKCRKSSTVCRRRPNASSHGPGLFRPRPVRSRRATPQSFAPWIERPEGARPRAEIYRRHAVDGRRAASGRRHRDGGDGPRRRRRARGGRMGGAGIGRANRRDSGRGGDRLLAC